MSFEIVLIVFSLGVMAGTPWLLQNRKRLQAVALLAAAFVLMLADASIAQRSFERYAQELYKEFYAKIVLAKVTSCGYYRVVEGSDRGDLIEYNQRLYRIINIHDDAIEWSGKPGHHETVKFADLCGEHERARIFKDGTADNDLAFTAWSQQ